MPRTAAYALSSWLLVPVAAILIQSALTGPRPFTGLVLRGDWVAAVLPGSPGERAGFAPGDRVPERRAEAGRRLSLGGPLAGAVPGRPVVLERVRDGRSRTVWLAPDPLPDGERRMMAAQLAVASVFVLLGGWVWSERRDRLTRTFLLLCLSFAWMLAPVRRWPAPALALADEVVLSAIQLFLPALCVHFFALFPESRPRGRRGRWAGAAYAIATILLVPSLALVAHSALGGTGWVAAGDVIQAATAVWFAAGLLTAVGLFATSYGAVGSRDGRRRLRVALIGTALGAGPLAALIAVRNLSPGTEIPGERAAVVLTLLVPASFAWAIAVHRIFDFRVALRAGVVTAVLAAAGGLAYAIGEWATATWWPERGAISGGALAFVALAASLAGPAAPWLGALGARVVPRRAETSLSAWSLARRREVGAEGRAAGEGAATLEQLLRGACETVAGYLRLDGCLALAADRGNVRPVPDSRSGAIREPGPNLRLRAAQLAGSGVQSVDGAALEPADREALELAGVGWLLPVGADPLRAVLLLGRRLAGPWLDRRETLEVERYAEHLAVALENAALRREASSHGALERELREAGAIQAHLLPRHAPICPTMDCAAAALSSEPVGGDYYDFVEGPGRDFTLVVGDAAGKGVPAALLLAQVQARFRGQAGSGLGPGQLLSALNHELVRLDQPEKFVGLLCARVDVRGARVWFANGGLTPPLVRRADGGFQAVQGGGILLGVTPTAAYPDVCVELGAGDVAVVHTDGLTEARRGEELFGAERVRQVLDRSARRRAADILEELLDEVRRFADTPLDDLTVVVIKQLTAPARAPVPPRENGLKRGPGAADAEGRGDTRPPSPARAANPRAADYDG